MKKRTDFILLAVFLLSLAVELFFIFDWLGIISFTSIDWPYWAQEWYTYLVIAFPAVPVFCLQLLLCRRARRWVSALPGLAIIGLALCFTHGFFTATGWDKLGWGILLILSIAPAVGCALAWAAYGIHQFYKRGDIRG